MQQTSAKKGRQKLSRNLVTKHPQRRSARVSTRGIDAMMAVRELARTYEQAGDRLLDRLHSNPGDRHMARSLSRHLDWLGARARMVNSFIAGGDPALRYLCAESSTPERLASLVRLTADNLAQDRLPVALFLMEKIDEELHLG